MKNYIKIDRGLMSPIFIIGLKKAIAFVLGSGFNLKTLKTYRDAGGVWVREKWF